jgi:lipopolysaccharide biosynthesis regulator YciM
MLRVPLAATLALALALGVQPAMRRGLREFPPLSALPSTPFIFQDAALASAGLRAAAADLAWIQLLQYAGEGLPEMADRRPFEHVGTLSLRVARLDPAFHRAYLFGAGILAWSPAVERPDEAIDVLTEGMRSDPGQPLYAVYIAAIGFKRRGEADRTLELLAPTLADPSSPIEMKAIVANLYKARGEYAKALALWEGILDNEGAAREWPRARIQVAEIEALLRRERAAARRQ